MRDLPVNLREKLDLIFRDARLRFESGQQDDGVALAELAWKELPEPKFEWDVSKSYVHALALIYRDARKHTDALALMAELFRSGTVKPYQDQPYFVTGTIYYEMGDVENATKWLGDAKRISKGRCFLGESSKYSDVVKN